MKIKPLKRGASVLIVGLSLVICGIFLGASTSQVGAQNGMRMPPPVEDIIPIPMYWVNFDVENSTGTWVNDYHIVVEKAEIVQ